MFYLFHGPDEFSMREELAKLRAGEDFGYNVETFSGEGVELAALRAACDTLPFLSERRLVLLEGLPKRKRATRGGDAPDGEGERSEPVEKPAGKGKKGKSGADPRAFAEGLAEYVSALPETTLLVVLLDETLEATHPLARAAQRAGRARSFTPPKGPQLEDWLIRRAKTLNATLAPDAARLLASEVGDNLRLLAGELEKLSAYAGAGGRIRVEEVRALTPASRQARVFDLTDALARRERIRALTLMHELLASGESPLGIVALTAFQTRALLQVKALAERGLRAPQIAQAAGMAPFVVEKSLPLARQFSFAQLEAAHRALLEVDTALKRSRMTPEMALDLLVVEFGSVASERPHPPLP